MNALAQTPSGVEVPILIPLDRVRVLVEVDHDAEVDQGMILTAVRDWLQKGGDPPVLLTVGCRVKLFGIPEVPLVRFANQPPSSPGARPGGGDDGADRHGTEPEVPGPPLPGGGSPQDE